MLTPQYSVRHLLLVVTLTAVVCLVPAMAARGHTWAVALSVGIYSTLVLLMTLGLLCALVRAAGAALRRARPADAPDVAQR